MNSLSFPSFIPQVIYFGDPKENNAEDSNNWCNSEVMLYQINQSNKDKHVPAFFRKSDNLKGKRKYSDKFL